MTLKKAAVIKQKLQGRTEVSSLDLWDELKDEIDITFDTLNTTLARLVKEGRLSVTHQKTRGRNRNLYTPTDLMNVKRLEAVHGDAEKYRLATLETLFANYEHLSVNKISRLSRFSPKIVRQTLKIMLDRKQIHDVGRCHNAPIYSSSQNGIVSGKQKVVPSVPPEVKERFKTGVSLVMWQGVKYLRQECMQ